MLFNTKKITVATLLSTLVSARPLDNRDIIPRNKSYEVVNVSGGSTPAPEPLVIISTQTVEVIKPGPTGEAPAIVTNPAISTPASTPCAPSSTSASSTGIKSSSAIPNETPKPVIVIISVPDDGPYYDDGMWHTRYRVKTSEAAAVATPSSPSSPPVLETPALPYNATM